MAGGRKDVKGQRHPKTFYQKNLLVRNELVVNDRKLEEVGSTQRVADELRQTGVPRGAFVFQGTDSGQGTRQ
jgi:hypothetical protein